MIVVGKFHKTVLPPARFPYGCYQIERDGGWCYVYFRTIAAGQAWLAEQAK